MKFNKDNILQFEQHSLHHKDYIVPGTSAYSFLSYCNCESCGKRSLSFVPQPDSIKIIIRCCSCGNKTNRVVLQYQKYFNKQERKLNWKFGPVSSYKITTKTITGKTRVHVREMEGDYLKWKETTFLPER